MKRLILIFSLMGLSAAPAYAQWTPPIGIPAPPFGIVQVTPTTGKTVSKWPTTMAAGDVVVLSGSIKGGTVTCPGTAEKPCWILGGSATLSDDFNVLGSYTILDGLHFSGLHSLGIGGSHNVVRNSTSVGTKRDPTGAAFYVTGTDCLVWRNRVTDHGDKTAKVDTDAHGISVVRPAQRTWILENESARNAGDGINVNPYPYDAQTWTAIGYVYIGRNVSHDNKQTGIWTKGSHDIIVSQNETYGHVSDPQGFSNGAGIGNQYAPQLVWYLYNNVHDNTVGFTVGGGLDNQAFPDPPGKSSYNIYIHNLVTNANGTTECGRGGVWECAAFFITGSGEYLLADNAIVKSAAGIHVIRAAGFTAFGTTGNSEVINDGVPPVVIPATPKIVLATVYRGFVTTYGIDVTGGTVPANGTVGPGAISPSARTPASSPASKSTSRSTRKPTPDR